LTFCDFRVIDEVVGLGVPLLVLIILVGPVVVVVNAVAVGGVGFIDALIGIPLTSISPDDAAMVAVTAGVCRGDLLKKSSIFIRLCGTTTRARIVDKNVNGNIFHTLSGILQICRIRQPAIVCSVVGV
jgi:hypothetical protein